MTEANSGIGLFVIFFLILLAVFFYNEERKDEVLKVETNELKIILNRYKDLSDNLKSDSLTHGKNIKGIRSRLYRIEVEIKKLGQVTGLKETSNFMQKFQKELNFLNKKISPLGKRVQDLESLSRRVDRLLEQNTRGSDNRTIPPEQPILNPTPDKEEKKEAPPQKQPVQTGEEDDFSAEEDDDGEFDEDFEEDKGDDTGFDEEEIGANFMHLPKNG